LAASTATPPDDLEICALARRAERALDALSVKKREAFVLVALEGLTGEEAAIAMNVPVATVWTRLHHARRDLRDALEEGE
jgi:RNA polymerase sigma-70 factor (ECF subfamily)